MTDAERNIIAKNRRGEHITPADTCATITIRDELKAYRDGLKRDGRLTTDAMAAIEHRRKQLGAWD